MSPRKKLSVDVNRSPTNMTTRDECSSPIKSNINKKRAQKLQKYSVSKFNIKSVIIYENVEDNSNSNGIDPEIMKNMSKEDRINLIRFGPDTTNNKPKQVAVDLLAKYKPKLNLNKYKIIAKDFDK